MITPSASHLDPIGTECIDCQREFSNLKDAYDFCPYCGLETTPLTPKDVEMTVILAPLYSAADLKQFHPHLSFQQAQAIHHAPYRSKARVRVQADGLGLTLVEFEDKEGDRIFRQTEE